MKNLLQKKLKLSIFCGLLVSCGTISQMTKEVITLNKGKANFEIEGNKIILKSVADKNGQYDFMFDTGFTFTTITDTRIIKDYSNRKFTTFGNPKMADKTALETRNLNIDFQNDLFSGESMFVKSFQKDSISCIINKYKGIIGMSIFDNEKAAIKIDFDKKQISALQNNYSSGDYFVIPSRMKGAHFEIEIDINGKKDYFLFDTGNSGGIYLKDDFLPNNLLTQEREGILTLNAKGITGRSKLKIYDQVNVKASSTTTKSKVYKASNIAKNNIGMSFIQNYNWILDWKNKKVLAQKRLNYEEKNSSQNDYMAIAYENKLIIANKNTKNDYYNVGTEILSIDDELVSIENICKLQTKLNKTKDWTTLNIKTK